MHIDATYLCRLGVSSTHTSHLIEERLVVLTGLFSRSMSENQTRSDGVRLPGVTALEDTNYYISWRLNRSQSVTWRKEQLLNVYLSVVQKRIRSWNMACWFRSRCFSWRRMSLFQVSADQKPSPGARTWPLRSGIPPESIMSLFEFTVWAAMMRPGLLGVSPQTDAQRRADCQSSLGQSSGWSLSTLFVCPLTVVCLFPVTLVLEQGWLWLSCRVSQPIGACPLVFLPFGEGAKRTRHLFLWSQLHDAAYCDQCVRVYQCV